MKGGVEVQVTSKLREAMACRPEFHGCKLLVEFYHRFARIWTIKERTPSQHVKDAAYCITFLGYWHKSIAELADKHVNISVKQNFITLETKRDVLIACNAVIIGVVIMRRFSEEVHPVPYNPGRWASRFSEYVFQFMRVTQSAGNKVTVQSALSQLHILDSQLVAEALGGLDIPASKRGMPRGPTRCNGLHGEALPQGYYPDDATLKRLIDEAVLEVQAALKEEVEFGSQRLSIWGEWLALVVLAFCH